MERETLLRIEPLCRQAQELPADEVPAFLDRACGDDAGLRSAVEKSLSGDRTAPEMGPAVKPADTSVGQQLGPYLLIRRIGAGGMGEVYLARDTRLHRHVAVKLLPPEWSRDDAARERFAVEARAASSLDHPNICTVHDVGTGEDGRFFLVMAYYQGETLRRKLEQGPLPVEQAVELAVQIGRGLERAHEAGIVHRDVKPANVMVTDRGEAKILDFGIAKIAGAVGLTRTGAVIGTTAYLSPEQARGGAVDARADVWGLGALLYEMLTGCPPFGSDHAQAVIVAILTADPAPLRLLRAEVPPELERIVLRALARKPEDRYQSAAEMVADLISGCPSPAAAASTLPSRAVGGTTIVEPAADAEPPAPVLRVLVATALTDGPRLLERLGDTRAFSLTARHDRAARDLLARFGGVEVDKQDGFLDLFERAADAVGFALAYHQALIKLSEEEGVELTARVGIHLGEVLLRRNPPTDVARGARPLEVEGLAKPIVARLVSLAGRRQTLLTSAVFDLARRAAPEGEVGAAELRWLAHGAYVFESGDEPLEVFEVGAEGVAPLAAPAGSKEVRRQVDSEDELLLGWRPAPGQPIPRRPNWLLAERLGEGGFGEVWLARHKSGEARVFKFCFEAARLRALKREVTLFRLLKEGLGHRDDIARILDWSFDHPPYFVESEHTAGGNLVDWAARQGGIAHVPLSSRLELAAQVADALAAAHSVGILHKDVKPANILIATDGTGQPKVRLTDFGIGLLTEQARLGMEGITALGFTETGLPTESGGTGTVRYMAPELLEGKPASIQADVYSLGVVLYQMVVGDFSRTIAPGWHRDIADDLLVEDLADLVDGHPERRPASAAEVAERLRTLEERRAAREKEKRDREEAEASRLAIERLHRRRRMATVVASSSLVVLAVVMVLAYQAVQARKEADQRRRQADELVDFMLGDLHRSLQSMGRLDVLGKVAAKSQEYLAAQPGEPGSAEASRRRGISLLATADVMLDQGETERAIEGYRAARVIFADLVGREPARRQWSLDLATSHSKLGEALDQGGESTAALESYRAAATIARQLLDGAPGDSEARLVLAQAHTQIGGYQDLSGQLADALKTLQTALDLTARQRPPAHAPWRYWQVVLNTHRILGNVYLQKGDRERAMRSYRAARAIAERMSVEDPANLNWRSDLARCQARIGVTQALNGEYTAAIDAYRSAVEVYRTLRGVDPTNRKWRTNLSLTLVTMGQVQTRAGHLEAALASYAQARVALNELATQDPANNFARKLLQELESSVGEVQWKLGQKRLALEAYLTERTMLSPLIKRDPEDRNLILLLALNHARVGHCYADRGDAINARNEWQSALTLSERLLAEPSQDFVRYIRGWALLGLGRIPEAKASLEGLRLPFEPSDFRLLDLMRKTGLKVGKQERTQGAR